MPYRNTMRIHFNRERKSTNMGSSKTPLRRKLFLCALLFAASAAAQSSSTTITEPVLGLVLDAGTQSIRTLAGIPAASRVGAMLSDGTPLSAAAISSELAYALALDGAGNVLLVSQSGQQPLAGVRAGAKLVAVSPGGTAAAVYYGDTGKASILTGMPDAPQVLREVTLDGPPSALAVSDDGAGLAAVVSLAANQATVFYYSPDASGQGLLSDRQFPSLEFVPGSATLVMATQNAVYLYQGRQGLQLVTDQRDGVVNVVGAAASADGARVFIGMASGQVAVRNLAASTQTVLSCSCQLAGLWRLRGKAVFRLNELGAGPLWVVDGDATQPRILFVAVTAGGNL
jgi:hypothetical protein